jgi:hypothetical protein
MLHKSNLSGHCSCRLSPEDPNLSIRVEAILEPEESRLGRSVPLNMPCYVTCRRWRGRGPWWGLCPGCHGRGVTEGAKQLILEIPPGSEDGNVMKSA